MTNTKINRIDHTQSEKLTQHCSAVLNAMEEIEMSQSEIERLHQLFEEAVETMRQLEWKDYLRRERNLGVGVVPVLPEEFRTIEDAEHKRASIRSRLETLEQEVAYLRSLND
jgi:lysine/ornithine N-monooxygenase